MANANLLHLIEKSGSNSRIQITNEVLPTYYQVYLNMTATSTLLLLFTLSLHRYINSLECFMLTIDDINATKRGYPYAVFLLHTTKW